MLRHLKHQEMVDLLRKYYRKIRTGFAFNLAGNINETKLVNAKKQFAKDLDEKSVLGFYDTSLKNNGWNGYLFTDTKVYYQETGGKPQIIDYDNIKNIKLISKGKKDRDNELRFEMMDGTVKIWKSILLNKTPLFEFFNELLQLDNISYGDEKKSDKDKEKSEDILHDRKQPETLMVKHQEKIDLLRKYYRKIRTGFAFNLAGNINETKLVNAKKNLQKTLMKRVCLVFMILH